MEHTSQNIWETADAKQLVHALCEINDSRIMQNFLRDVMTEKEIIEVSARLEAAKMLAEGKKYSQIIEKTKLSSRTVARISHWMKNGMGGYSAALRVVDEPTKGV